MRRARPQSPPERHTLLRPWLVVLVVCLVYLLTVAARFGNVLEFVRMGSQYAGSWGTFVRDAEGYDGQFNYYLAIDPVNAAEHLDVPAYRTQRILYPALARVLALGQVNLVPYALLLIDGAALVIGTALLERLLLLEQVNRWYALSYGLFGGLLVAVRSSTSEPLAYGLVLAAILAIRQERVTFGALLLALAAFSKETTLLFAIGYLLYYALHRQWRRLLTIGLLVGIPFSVWQVLLYQHLGVIGIGSGGAGATGFEIIPFNGLWRIAADGARVFLTFGILPLVLAFLPTVWALWQSITDLIARRDHPYSYLLLINALVIPFLPFSTYREPLGLFRFLDGLLIAILLYAGWRKSYRVLRYSLIGLLFGLVVLG